MVLAVLLIGAQGAFGAVGTPSFMTGFPMQAGNIIMMMWAPVPGAVKYRIYVNGELKGEVPLPPFQTPTPEKAGTYNFEITAVGADGTESARSRAGTVAIIKIEPPKEMNVRTSEGKVFMQWSVVPGAAIYNVYRTETAGKDYKLVESVQDPKFSDSKVQKGKTYYYVVTSKDLTGKESEQSPPQKVEIASVEESTRVPAKVYPIKVAKSKLALEITSTLDWELKEVSDLLFLGGKVYAVDQGMGNIKVFSAEGEGRILIPNGMEEEKIATPMGIGKGPQGTIAVAEGLSNDVKIFTTEGQFVRKLVLPPMPEGWPKDLKEMFTKNLLVPAAADVDTGSDGKVYVVDSGWHRVVEYSADGKVLAQHGKKGDGKGEYFSPKTIVTMPDGRIVVGEGLGRRVQVFDSSFKFLSSFGVTNDWVGAFLGITGMAVVPGGERVACVDGPMYTVQYFDSKGFDYLYHVGGESGDLDAAMEKQRPVLAIGYPVGVAVDDKSRVWIGSPQQKKILVLQITSTP